MSGLVANYESGEEPSPTAPPATEEEYDPLAAAAEAAGGDEYQGYPPESSGDGEPPVKQAPAEAPDAAEAAEAHAALVARLKDYVSRGLDPSQEIRKNRDFHNPMLLEKIVRYFDIDDIASQFPKHLFDPEAIANRRSKDKKKGQSSPRAAEAAAPPPA
jgi:hypothetical protein